MRTALIFLITFAGVATAGVQKCEVNGEIVFTDGLCPDKKPGQQVEIRKHSMGNYEDAQRMVRDGRAAFEADRRRSRSTPSDPNKIKRASDIDRTNAIRSNRVIPGMNQAEVERSLGKPDSTYTGSDGYTSWSYNGYDSQGRYRSKTVTFRNGLTSGSDTYASDERTNYGGTDSGKWLNREDRWLDR